MQRHEQLAMGRGGGLAEDSVEVEVDDEPGQGWLESQKHARWQQPAALIA